MIETTANVCMTVLGVTLFLSLWRVLVGPTTSDRVVALDAVTINILALIAVTGILRGTQIYLDAVLVIAILGFFGTVAMAKYLVGGTLADRDPR